jgi:hypothetical protein
VGKAVVGAPPFSDAPKEALLHLQAAPQRLEWGRLRMPPYGILPPAQIERR